MPGNKCLMAASTGPMTFTKTTADESYVREARTTGPIEQVSGADKLVGYRFYHVRVRAFVPFPLPPLKGDSDRTSRCDPRKAVVIVDFTHKGVVHRVWPSGLATHTVFIRTQQGSVVRAFSTHIKPGTGIIACARPVPSIHWLWMAISISFIPLKYSSVRYSTQPGEMSRMT